MTKAPANVRATWWRLTGWEKGPEPAPYAAEWLAMASYEEEMPKRGYENLVCHEDQPHASDVQVAVWQHQDDDHLFVMLSNGYQGYSSFFVTGRDADAFMATAYLDLLRAGYAEQQARALQDMRRMFLAFVRHGHGENTIDSYGSETRDERRRRLERGA